MTIERGQGNLITAEVDALVNTVNTEGVMGKGSRFSSRRRSRMPSRNTSAPATRVRSRSDVCTSCGD